MGPNVPGSPRQDAIMRVECGEEAEGEVVFGDEVYSGFKMDDARFLASVPRRRLRRPVSGARMSSAARARLRVSREGPCVGVAADVCCVCDCDCICD